LDPASDDTEQRVPRSVFSVDNIPAGDRYDVWQESISCIFDVDADRGTRRDGFSASVDSHLFGQVLLARTTTVRQTWTRSALTAARDGMDHYMIQLYEAGHMVCEHSGGVTEMPTGGLMVFDLAQNVTCRTDNFSNISLVLPRSMLDGMLKSADDQHMRTLTSDEPLVTLLREHMLTLKRLADRMTLAQAVEIGPATAGLAAACLNGSMDGATLGTGRPTLRDTTIMARCKRFIDANLSRSDLTPNLVAAEVGVSRTRLYQLFEGHGGIAHYIRERRLRRALLALADQTARDRPIYDIALASGFGSDAAFSRLFRQRYGMTPSDVRHGSAKRATIGALHYDVDRRYETWLNRLAV
jgi:AraC-like DNA-binding protein